MYKQFNIFFKIQILETTQSRPVTPEGLPPLRTRPHTRLPPTAHRDRGTSIGPLPAQTSAVPMHLVW